MNAVEVAGVIETGTPKAHKRRDVPYPAFLSELMAQQIAGKGHDGLVFSDADGQHLRRTRVSTGSRSWFKTALREAELEPMTLHDLRHTAGLYADLFDDDLDDVAMRLHAAVSAASVGKMWASPSPTN